MRDRRVFNGVAWECAEIGKCEEITDRNDFKEACEKGLEGWRIGVNILGKLVGDFHDVGKRGLEEAQVNNDVGGNQLGNQQYKLTHRNEKCSSERSQKITEREMTGLRKEIPNDGGLITAMGVPRAKLK